MRKDDLYIYEVYKEKSFSQAARNLFISQPALSSSVRKIEEEVGVQIFDRNTLPIRLTEAGKIYIEALEKMAAIEKEMNYRINELANLKMGHVVISGTNMFSAYVLPPVIRAFVAQYPGVELELVESDSMMLYEEALKDNIDLIVDAGSFDEAMFEAEVLFTENVLLGVPADNPLNREFERDAMTREEVSAGVHLSGGRKAVDISAFRDQSFILLKQGHDMHRRGVAICRGGGFIPRTTLNLNQLSTVFSMGEYGLGCCFLTDTLIRLGARGESSMLYYRLDDPAASRDVFIAHKIRKPITKAAEKFIQIARQIYQ